MKVSLLNLLIVFSVIAFGQNTSDSIKLWTLDKSLIDNGGFKNYYQYDLGAFLFYNGRYENNLTFLIQSKDNQEIVFSEKDTLSDAMFFKPKFFHNKDNSLIIIMIEVAAEYSWGQKVLIIKDGVIKDFGFLDYAVDIANGESISEYCEFIYKQRQIQLIFKDVPIIDWQNESESINGKDLIFEFCNNDIRRVKTKYDYYVEIDMKHLQYVGINTYKYLINKSWEINENDTLIFFDSNSAYYIKYDYVRAPQKGYDVYDRIPIDTLKFDLTDNQLDSIFKLTKEIFTIDSISIKNGEPNYDIYDGEYANVTLDLDKYTTRLETRISFEKNTIFQQRFYNLLNYIEKIKNAL